ncbi:MAG: hypothetical protein M1822_005432 [Bathelium mastoideum]|nr:MAG: hypothetical protein M1822_005432 [Bathelium mastoideum]
MATSQVINLDPTALPDLSVPSIKPDAAQKASELLTDNDKKHHIFFNEGGFHNHITHHLLTVYALGASPSLLAKQYESDKSYQRPKPEADELVVERLRDRENWSQYLGNGKYYGDFLEFFQREIAAKGWEQVLMEYLFAQDENAKDLLLRMYGVSTSQKAEMPPGFLHPLIHLGFGIEFRQPAIIAEGLAQAAVHANWIGKLFLAVEHAAPPPSDAAPKSIVQLLDEIRADESLSTAAHWDDGNKVRDGILVRAPERMVNIARQFTADPARLAEQTAEMTAAVVYYTGAAQRPTKQIKFDFYFMHCVNCSIFFPAMFRQAWLPDAAKARLLEWKVWMDLTMYASRRSPALLLNEITDYRPRQPTADWEPLFQRAVATEDDGHTAKLVRALAHGQRISAPYEHKDAFRIKGDMWLQLGHMVMDSVEDSGERWVRSAGFDEAWTDLQPRAQL